MVLVTLSGPVFSEFARNIVTVVNISEFQSLCTLLSRSRTQIAQRLRVSGSVVAIMDCNILQHPTSDSNDRSPIPSHTASGLLLQSTPIKTSTATTLPYTTHQKFRIPSCTQMGNEMMHYIVGPMPVQTFLDEFLPLSKLRRLKKSTYKQNCYKTTIKAKLETHAYQPFVSSL